MAPNRSLKKINVSKTEVTDKVCTKISAYLKEPDLRLHDINLSRNQIAADGLIAIAEALFENTSLITLNLAQNFIREGGIIEFVQALKANTTLQDPHLAGLNQIRKMRVLADPLVSTWNWLRMCFSVRPSLCMILAPFAKSGPLLPPSILEPFPNTPLVILLDLGPRGVNPQLHSCFLH